MNYTVYTWRILAVRDVFFVTFLLMRGPQLCSCDGTVAVLVQGAEVVEPQVGLPEEDLFFSDMNVPVQVVGLGDNPVGNVTFGA